MYYAQKKKTVLYYHITYDYIDIRKLCFLFFPLLSMLITKNMHVIAYLWIIHF